MPLCHQTTIVRRGGLAAIVVVGLLGSEIVAAAASGHPSLRLVHRSSHEHWAYKRRHGHADHRRRGGRHSRSSVARAAIIGGQVAGAGTFPWLAKIFDVGGEGVSGCTGTVIAPKLILTAGHCAEDTETGIINEPSGYRVITGNVDWADTADRQVSTVSRVIVYPGFNQSTLVGDAALLELATPTSAPAITLAADLAGMPAGTAAIIAGWGKTFYAQEYSTEWLRWAETAVQGPTWCEENATPFYPGSKLCTIDPPYYETGTCQGDSGGPLLAQWPEGGALVEIGITSSGFGECATTRPDEFTRSDLVASWVHEWAQALKRQEEEAATAAAAKRRQEEEAAAAKKRQEEDVAATRRRHEEEAAAAAAANRRREKEGGVYRGTTSQSDRLIALVLARGGRQITGLATTIAYRCRNHTFTEPVELLSNRDPEWFRADHSFHGTFSGNPRYVIAGAVNPVAGTVSGTFTGTYKTGYGRCSTGHVSWSAQRQPPMASTSALTSSGSYRGWLNGSTRIAITVGATGRDLVGLLFSAVYRCPRHHYLRLSDAFLSGSDTQALDDFGTFTMYMDGSRHYRARMDGTFGLMPGSAFGTFEASTVSRYGRCATGLIYWQASLAH